MANTLRLEIVTPEATVYSEEVDMVTLPGVEGEMGILPQHVRLMTQLVPGEMIVRKDGHDHFLAVGEGLVEITANRVAIVTNMATHCSDGQSFNTSRESSDSSSQAPYSRAAFAVSEV